MGVKEVQKIDAFEGEGNQQPNNMKEKNHIPLKKHRTCHRWTIFILLTLFSLPFIACILLRHPIQAFELASTSLYKKILGIGSSFSFCSSHGVMVDYGRKCVCDVGYYGASCSQQAKDGRILKVPNPQSILFVLESFGSLNPDEDLMADSYELLAENLALDDRFDISILYIGKDKSQFKKISEIYESKRIKVLSLPSSDLSFGSNQIEKLSHEVYIYLNSLPRSFGIVYFTTTSGAGYFTLLSNHQGMQCSRSKYVVGIDEFSKNTLGHSYNTNLYQSNLDTLKLDYVQKMSVELADKVVVSSNMLLESILNEDWIISEHQSVQTVRKLPIQSLLKIEEVRVFPHELVYISESSISDGIDLFCDVLDKIHNDLSSLGIVITFIVPSQDLNELTRLIANRANVWNNSDLKYQIKITGLRSEILYYMTESRGRFAVIPSTTEVQGLITWDLLNAGVPFVTTQNNAVKELVSKFDQNQAIVEANSETLKKIIIEIVKNGVFASSQNTKFNQIVQEWVQLFSEIGTKDLLKCKNKYDKIENPLVSVVITHHNRHKLLKQAIDGLKVQTYGNYEIILVDRGSDNKESLAYLNELTWKMWEEHQWKVIREKKLSLGVARNVGTYEAAGKFILFMDDDDYPKPNWIETLVKAAINTDADIVTSGHDYFGGLLSPKFSSSQGRYIPLGPALLVGFLENVFGNSHFLVKKQYFQNSGGFSDDNETGYEHYEFLAKAVAKGFKLESVAESLTWSRINSNPLMQNLDIKAVRKRVLNIYKEEMSENQKSKFRFVRRDLQDILPDNFKGYDSGYEYISSVPSWTMGFNFATQSFSLPLIPVYETLYPEILTFSFQNEYANIETTISEIISLESTIQPTKINFETESIETVQPSEISSLEFTWSETISNSLSYSIETSYVESDIIETLEFLTESMETFQPFTETNLHTYSPVSVETVSQSFFQNSSRANTTLVGSTSHSENIKSTSKTYSSTRSSFSRSTSNTRSPAFSYISPEVYQTMNLPVEFPRVATTAMEENSVDLASDFPLSFMTYETVEFGTETFAPVTFEQITQVTEYETTTLETIIFVTESLQTALPESTETSSQTNVPTQEPFGFPLTFPTWTYEQEYAPMTEAYTSIEFPLNFPTLYTESSEFKTSKIPTATFELETETETAVAQPTDVLPCQVVDCARRCIGTKNYGSGCTLLVNGIEPAVLPNRDEVFNITIFGKDLFNKTYLTFQTKPNFVIPKTESSIAINIHVIRQSNNALGNNDAIAKLQEYTESAILKTAVPLQIFARRSITIDILGTGIVTSMTNIKPICIYRLLNATDTVIEVQNGTIISSNTIKCLTPPDLVGPSKVLLNIRYDNPRSEIPYLWDSSGLAKYFLQNLFLNTVDHVNNGIVLTVLPLPPVLIKAQFSNNGTTLGVTFSQPIKILDDFGNQLQLSSDTLCSAAFIAKAPGLGTLITNPNATTPQCRLAQFDDKKKLWLILSTSFSQTASDLIKVGDLLGVKNNVIENFYIHSETSSGSIVVGTADIPTIPSISISAPNAIPGCGSIPVSLAGTSGNAYRYWENVNITFTSNLDMSLTQNLTSSLAVLASTILTYQYNFIIPSDVLPPANYVFKFTFTNFIGGTSSASFYVKKFKEIDVPVLIFTPQDGSYVKVNTDNVLAAAASQACAPELQGVPLAYSWSLSQDSSDIPEFPATTDKSILVLTAFSMLPLKTYNFNLMARYNQPQWNSYNFSISLLTDVDYLTASAGSSRRVGSVNKIILSAGISSDGYSPSVIAANKDNTNFFSCVWSCKSTVENVTSSCSDLNGNELALPKLCVNLNMTGLLSPGLYQWRVQITNLNTNSTAASPRAAFLEIIEGQVPSVLINPTEDTPSSWNPRFYVDSNIDLSTINSPLSELTYTWSIPEECDQQPFQLLTLYEGVNTLTPINNPTIKLPTGTMEPLLSYCFQLNVKDPTIVTEGQATYAISIRDRPRYGTCNPVMDSSYLDSNGNVNGIQSFTQSLTISCSNWQTDSLSYPLLYLFEYRTSSTGSWSILQAKSTSTLYSSFQSAGSKEIRITVLDSAYSPNDVKENSLTLTSTVLSGNSLMRRQSVNDLTLAISTLKQLITDFASTGNGQDAQTKITVIASSLPSNISTSQEIQLQLLVSNFTDNLVNSGNIFVDTDKIAPWLASLFSNLVGGQYTIGISLLESLLKTLNVVLKMAAKNGDALGTCFNTEAGEKYIQTMDLILGSLTTAQSQSPYVAETLSSSLKIMETCIARSKACGESPFSKISPYLARSIGVASAIRSTSFCGFSASGLTSVLGSSSCVSFACGSKVGSELYNNTGNLINVDYSKVFDLSFRDLNSELNVPVNFTEIGSSGYVNVTLPISSSFNLEYNLLNYTVGQLYITGNSSFKPTCAFLNSDNIPSLSGCTLLAIDAVADTITCACSHLTDFAVSLLPLTVKPKEISPSQSPTSTQGITQASSTSSASGSPRASGSPEASPSPIPSSFPAGIVGGAAGAAVVLIIAAVAVYIVRKKRKARLAQQAQVNGEKPPELETAKPEVVPKALLVPQLSEVPSMQVDAEIVPIALVGSQARRRDPALLPVYQSPPTYEEHMRKKEIAEMNHPARISTNSQRVASTTARENVDVLQFPLVDTEVFPEETEIIRESTKNPVENILNSDDSRVSANSQTGGDIRKSTVDARASEINTDQRDSTTNKVRVSVALEQVGYAATQFDDQEPRLQERDGTELALEESTRISYHPSDEPKNEPPNESQNQ
ncbi:hypothetical protein HK096_004967 [Nowakowskiella sp. JEL0078]|nr:hypothetical protein HK096_004967 [Nowakowskiella sp. JEL0078]